MISPRKIISTVASVSTALFVFSQPLLAAYDYSEALNISTKFFGAQRCGATDSWIHAACHSNDGKDEGVDLTGGWHDCGDHVKFGQTNGFAAALLLHGYLYFPSAYPDNYSPKNSSGASNSIPDVLDEVKYYTDYALKILVGNSLSTQRLFFQVSNSDDDHNTVMIPENSPNDRESHYVEGGGAANIAGINAAVLAMMYRAYYDIDKTYANECLDMAKKMYTFGDADHTSQASVDANDKVAEPYEAGPWLDDMLFAATELYAATHDTKYSDAAKSFIKLAEMDDVLPSGSVLDYSNIGPVAAHSYLKNVENSATLTAKLKEEADSYEGYVGASGQAFFDAWGSLKSSAGAGYVALLARDVGISSSVDYVTFARDQIDFILGDHGNLSSDAPSGYSFLADFGSNSVMGQIHHCAAAGLQTSDMGSWNDGGYSNKYDLIGALVGGPTTAAGAYVDERWDYQTNEVCIYYNAPFVAALGALIDYDAGGEPNRAPTDIMLSNTNISSGQPAGTNLGDLTTMDPDAGDTHSYTIVTGGDKFELSGSTVKTKGVLTVGTSTLKIKSTDNGGLSYEKDFTITVVDGGDPNNLLYELAWYAYTNGYGSKVNGQDEDTTIIDDSGVVYVDFDIPLEVEDSTGFDGIWPGAAIEADTLHVTADGKFSYEDGVPTNLSKIDFIILEYKCNEDFKMTLPLGAALTDDNEYSTPLKNTNGSLTVDTIYLNDKVFTQEAGWGKTTAFDKSKMYNFNIITAFNNKKAYFELQTIVIDGIEPTPILKSSSSFGVATKNIVLNSITTSKMNISIPEAGYYNINLYSLNGRAIQTIKGNMSKGNNSISWNGSGIGSGMVIVRINSKNHRSINKVLIK